MSEDLLSELVEWLRARPPSLLPLIRRFPPGCRVRAKAGHRFVVPAAGETALVTSYTEPNAANPDGGLGVDGNSIFGPIHTFVSPDAVEIADHGKCSPETLAAALAAIEGRTN